MKTVLGSILLVASLAPTAAAAQVTDSGPTAPVGPTRNCVVERIVDGDTFVCEDGERIRLIGMDTPELGQPPFGKIAAKALAELVPVGDTVQLESDVEPHDRYRRTLAHVWSGGRLVNWLLVRRGYALLLTIPPNLKYVEALTAAQKQAREEDAGLWATGGFDCTPAGYRHGECEDRAEPYWICAQYCRWWTPW